MGGFQKLGLPFWGPRSKAHNSLGSILRSLPLEPIPSLKPSSKIHIRVDSGVNRVE